MAEDRARQIGRCVKGDGGRATTHSPFPIPHRLAIRHIAGAIAWRGIALLQRLEADALGLGALLA